MTFFRTGFQADDGEHAERWLLETHGDIRLAGDVRGFAERMVGDTRFAVCTTSMAGHYGCDAEFGQILVSTASGGYTWQVGRDTGCLDGEPALFQPGDRLIADIVDAEARTLALDVGALRDTASMVYGIERAEVRFDGPRPVSAAAAGSLKRLLEDAASLGEGLESETLRALTFRALAVSVLEGFRLVGEVPDRHLAARERYAAYRRATRFIDDFASLPITVADVAHAVGLPVRDLMAVFRAHAPQGVSPRGYLGLARLDAARADLDRDPTQSRDRVAHRWGFSSAAVLELELRKSRPVRD
ncbi:helix-turn-helix domain-containing protein [Humibacter sp. BT305]|nr:helix-turn-helix domain-containing protein [Humibacter sp. BT305]